MQNMIKPGDKKLPLTNIWNECYTHKKQPDGTVICTMYDPSSVINTGVHITMPARPSFKVMVVTSSERRGHRGVFKDPESAVNSFVKFTIQEAV